MEGGRCLACCLRSPLKKGEEPCEDALMLFDAGPLGVFVALADGAGGHQSGRAASGLVLDTVGEALIARAAQAESGFTAPAFEALETANQRVRELGVGAATTFAAASIRDLQVRTLHVGDSEVVLMGQRGAIRLQTVSHSPVGYAREAGLLDEEEALLHEDRHIVSNMVGADDMRVEIAGATPIAPRDTLLLASDGLFDNLYLGEIVEICRKGPLERAADQLEQRARDRMSGAEPGMPGKADDLSFILYRRTVPPRGS